MKDKARPWSRTDNDCPHEEYAGWQKWMRERLMDDTQSCFENMDILLQANLYSIMCDIADALKGSGDNR